MNAATTECHSCKGKTRINDRFETFVWLVEEPVIDTVLRSFGRSNDPALRRYGAHTRAALTAHGLMFRSPKLEDDAEDDGRT